LAATFAISLRVWWSARLAIFEPLERCTSSPPTLIVTLSPSSFPVETP